MRKASLPRIKICDSNWLTQKPNMIKKFVEFVKKQILDELLRTQLKLSTQSCKQIMKSFRQSYFPFDRDARRILEHLEKRNLVILPLNNISTMSFNNTTKSYGQKLSDLNLKLLLTEGNEPMPFF